MVSPLKTATVKRGIITREVTIVRVAYRSQLFLVATGFVRRELVLRRRVKWSQLPSKEDSRRKSEINHSFQSKSKTIIIMATGLVACYVLFVTCYTVKNIESAKLQALPLREYKILCILNTIRSCYI